MPDEKKEIVSLNKELMSLDFDDITVEELERRLELAVAMFIDVEPVGCTGFSCTGFTCTTNT
jgi:hypothetical protein